MSSFNWPPAISGNTYLTFPTFGDFTAGSFIGELAVDQATGNIYEWSGTVWQLIGGPGIVIAVGPFGSTPNANGLSIASNILNMQPADGTHPGGVSIIAQTLAGAKTFSTSVISPILSTASANPASAGVVRLANTELIAWRNSVNSADITLTVASSGAMTSSTTFSATGNVIASTQLISTVATGTAPLAVASTTVVANLNAATSVASTTATNLAGGLGGSIPYQSALSTTAMLANGSAGQALVSAGTTLAPVWQNVVSTVSIVAANGFAGTVATATTTPAITISTSITGILQGNGTAISAASTTGSGNVVLSTSPTLVTPALGTPTALVGTNITGTAASFSIGGNAATATTATNLAGGLGGSIPYQSAVGVTVLLANGNSGQVLQSNGTTLAPSWATAGTGTVTSVGAAGPTSFATWSAAITGSGTLTQTLSTQAAGTYFGGPYSGANATPAYLAFRQPNTISLNSTGTQTGWLFTISTSSTMAVGDTYTNNGNTYTALGALSAQSGQVLFMSGTGATSGTTLTRATGSGTASITFGSKIALATYTPSTGVLYVRVKQVGAGGGSSGSGTAGGTAASAGLSTFFGANIVITTGGGAGVFASNAASPGTSTINSPATGRAYGGSFGQGGGGGGGNASSGGCGGGNALFGPGAGGAWGIGTAIPAVGNSGGGAGGPGGDNVATAVSGTGGSGGGAAEFILNVTAFASTGIPYVIGTGGSGGGAGVSGLAGTTGADGCVFLYECFQ